MDFNFRYVISGLFLFLLFVANNNLIQASEVIELLKPVHQEKVSDNIMLNDSKEVYISRTGQVSISVNELFTSPDSQQKEEARIHQAFDQTKLVLSFFQDQEVIITVDSESRPGNNIVSLGGHHEEKKISTFSMTITDESYLITYQDLDNSIVYKVVGNCKTGIGKVTEIDLKKLPPVYDSEPIVPPGK